MSLQTAVADLDSQGLDEHEIAARLEISPRVVRNVLERVDGVFDPERPLGVLAERAKREPILRDGTPAPVVKRGKPLAPCGTPSAWQRHKRNKEDVDPACAEAMRVEWRERSERRRAGAGK